MRVKSEIEGWGGGTLNLQNMKCDLFVLGQKSRNGEAGNGEEGAESSALCLRNTAAPHVLGQCQGWTPLLPQWGEREVCLCVCVF